MREILAEKPAVQNQVYAKQSTIWILVASCLASISVTLQPPLWLLRPPEERPFDADFNYVLLLASLSGIITVIFLLTSGVLGDLHGRRLILLLGLGGTIVANLLTIITPNMPNLWWFGFTRFLALVMSAMVLPLALAFVYMTFSGKSRAPALALLAFCNLVASQLAWIQGAYFAAIFGWRAPFILPIVFSAISIVFVSKQMPETVAATRRSVDALAYMGWTLVVLATAFGLLVMPIASQLWQIVAIVALIVTAIGTSFIIWWYKHTNRDRSGVVSSRTRDLTVLLIVGLVLNFTLVGYCLRVLGYLQVALGLSIVTATLSMAPILIGTLLALFMIVAAMHKRQVRVVVAGGLLAMGIGSAATAILPLSASYWLYILPFILFGIGYLVTATVWMSAFLRTAIDGYDGLTAAINRATALIGAALGSAITANLLGLIGNTAYADILRRSQATVTESVEALAAFNTLMVDDPAAVQAATTAAQPLLVDGYAEAYGIAFDSVLWLMAGLCVLSAFIIVLGLRRSMRVTRGPKDDDEDQNSEKATYLQPP